MNRHVVYAAIAIVCGLSACTDSSSPTSTGQDLLKTPSASPSLGESMYGQPNAGGSGGVTPVPIAYNPVDPFEAVISDTAKPGYVHITAGEYASKYRPDGSSWVHIADDYNPSKYKRYFHEHIKTGDDQSKYKPEGWEHYNGPRTADKTKYIPAGAQHNTSGPNETLYSSGGNH